MLSSDDALILWVQADELILPASRVCLTGSSDILEAKEKLLSRSGISAFLRFCIVKV